MARVAGERLSASTGPVKVLIPLQGWWQLDRPGGPLENPEGMSAYLETFKAHLSPRLQYQEVDAHINDPEFADEAVASLLALIRG